MEDLNILNSTEMICRAASFAIKAHGNDCRKDGVTPAFLHAAEAASIAVSITGDPEIIAAVFLHDVLEDTDTPENEILENFGNRVYSLVKSETEDAGAGLSRTESWKMRKSKSLYGLEHAKDEGTSVMWLSDKLSNIRAIHRDVTEIGYEVFKRFNQKNPAEHEWYYREIARILKPLEKTEAYKEYIWLVNDTFKEERSF